MRIVIITLFILTSVSSFSQKKVLDHADVDLWNTINNKTISNNGNYIMYSLEKGEKDNHLKIKDKSGRLIFDHERSENGMFTSNSNFAMFTVKAWKDSITEMKRRKVKKDKMPKDTLAIYNLSTNKLTKIANVKSYKSPAKWSAIVAYYVAEIKTKSTKKKDTSAKAKKTKKPKKVSKTNGYHLVIRNLTSGNQDTIKYVTNFSFAEEGKRMVYVTTGDNENVNPGVYVLNLENNSSTQVFNSHKKTKYYQVNLSDSGKNLGFVVDADTTKALVRPNKLYHWSEGTNTASLITDDQSAPQGYFVSSHGSVSFSKDETKLYFGLATPPIVKDTTLLKEEIVNVEVWTYDEPRLYTVQELQVNNDKKKSYLTAIHLNKNNRLVQLGTEAYPSSQLGDEGNAAVTLVNNPVPYQLESQWTAQRNSDYTLINVNTGGRTNILTEASSGMRLSPKAKYVYGYQRSDTTWIAYGINSGKKVDLTKGRIFYNELNDSPNYPASYGIAGWTEDDEAMLIYDRYDIWEFNPDTGASKRLTNGRESKITYRYVNLDSEEQSINKKGKWLLSTFNENNKHSGYYQYNAKNGKGKQLISGPYGYGGIAKAKEANHVIYTRQSFEEFPDVRISDLSFKNETKLTNANPQQKEYNWGTSELIKWTSLDGKELSGMLIKPENFDPNKKYPLIVNFYEKSSDGLYRHRAPSHGRSTINYSFYTSRGYVIFNPDVYYRIGYPGESAYNCVIPGITSLIEKGFIDKDNIGVQGHSWGGYQIAHLVTKTDIFKAAEAGAPVPNMISAYGGIRWWTGLSRQFQYEHTQSRIGGTPWEYPARYVENSPIFNLDKVNTPLLIMHNDADGHVPWYQGIELFVSLRRLGKPSWFLNYNDEPHWPLKLQNRKDFNIRLAQFFDYYLKGAPKPVWMEKGVPAIEKGINQGLELMEKN
jgi:dipeptidyl aminopeptidase/acylaminoacyl peptidase